MGTRTSVFGHDGADLAAAWQTIREIGDERALDKAVEDAFPGARVSVSVDDGRFTLQFAQHGLLRPLNAMELSDGTLRYVLWIAAMHTPRPPPLMVLNEPETSLHPNLLPALARLIVHASSRSQVWMVSHASRLISALEADRACQPIALEKDISQATHRGAGHAGRTRLALAAALARRGARPDFHGWFCHETDNFVVIFARHKRSFKRLLALFN
ncbi:AAA family ATPase [Dyella amyloliquefaciens]|uniref:AAA family ATPase n=1 Tax=Dyella amyloliquefaciens TaxID=1770545 RepID=UPI001E401D3F|nr:AAA family ATPase [Dyella amyloliquefaciens]